jgi:hypothetical protein
VTPVTYIALLLSLLETVFSTVAPLMSVPALLCPADLRTALY